MHYSKLLILFVIILGSCNISETKNQGGDLNKITIRGETQGTYYSIIYYDSINRDFTKEIDSLLNQIDMSASTYKSSSIVSRINNNESVELDKIFIDNFNISKIISEETKGAFDITVMPLVKAWGFGEDEPQKLDSASVDSLLEFVGYEKINIVGKRLEKENPNIQIDFNAIAQGYSVDYVADFLISKDIRFFLVDIGGELLASKSKPDESKWKVGIEVPEENSSYGQNLAAVLPLSGKAMATSGNYRKFYEKDGVKYTHTVNPISGYTVSSNLLSATVIADKAAIADAYATAFMVMGKDKSIELIESKPNLEAFLIYSDENGNYKYYISDNIRELVEIE